MFVVKALTSVSLAVRWNAALSGGMICQPPFVNENSGPCLTFCPAIASTRFIWISNAFIAAHPDIASATIARPGLGQTLPALYLFCF